MKNWVFIGMVSCLFSCSSPTQEKIIERQLPFYTAADFTPHWYAKGDTALQKIHTIPAFSFTNQNGETITNKTMDGKIYVANFFFTTCPGICKQLSNNLKLVQDSFKNETGVIILSHSVTPENDSVVVLKRYEKNYNINGKLWHLLTGKREDIYNIARKAYFADEDLGMKKNINDFLHTENILLIDKHKRIRGVYKGTAQNEVINMVADIKILQLED